MAFSYWMDFCVTICCYHNIIAEKLKEGYLVGFLGKNKMTSGLRTQ